eukprot:6281818-Alexandrium_andersonii.AAC.1
MPTKLPGAALRSSPPRTRPVPPLMLREAKQRHAPTVLKRSFRMDGSPMPRCAKILRISAVP